MTSRRDIGQLPPRAVNGVPLPPEGAVNELTLVEKLQHQRQYKGSIQFPLFSRAEALAAGYGENEVREVYGEAPYLPDDPRTAKPLPLHSFVYDDEQLVSLLLRHLQIECPALTQRRLEFRVRHGAASLRIDVYEPANSR